MELLYAREYTQGERAWERGYLIAVFLRLAGNFRPVLIDVLAAAVF